MSVHRLDAFPVTISATALVWLKAPLVPVMTSGYPFAGVLAAGVTVRIEFPELRELGLKLNVAPVGNPLTLKATGPVNPLSASTFTVYWMLDPVITAGG